MANEHDAMPGDATVDPGQMLLLEASAGTGKTYQIEELVLGEIARGRADLHHVLVLTYTEAATAELRSRIRNRLRGAAAQVREQQITEKILSEPSLPKAERGLALERLEEALAVFDDARIFTIHGFCQRVLSEFAIESNASFEATLVEDEARLVREAVRDYWLALQADPGDEREVLLRFWGMDSAELVKLLSRRLAFPLAPVRCHSGTPGEVDFDEAGLDWLREALERFGEAFLEEGEALDRALGDRKTFSQDNRLGFGAAFRESLWGKMSRPGEPLRPEELQGIALLTEDYLTSRLKKNAEMGEEVRKLRIPGIATEIRERLAALRWAWLRGFLDTGARMVADLKDRYNVKVFQDLLQDLYQGLTGPRGSFLREAVARRFTTVFIDEFQDTDFLQWEIFERLFRGPGHRLFVIGDPKQAIYDFRGADVHAYLRAASVADRRQSLGWNYRSDARLVEAVNAFFLSHSHPFGLSGIDYRKVGARKGVRFHSSGGAESKPFQIRAVDRAVKRADDLRAAVVEQVVVDVAGLLASGSEINLGGGWNGVDPRDIAILVRKSRQAHRLRQGLVEAGIPAVVSSDESVFDSGEAAELMVLLKAVLQPGNTGLSRRLLLGVFFEVDPSLLGDPEMEVGHSQTNRLAVWRECWLSRGVAALLKTVFEETGVVARLLGRLRGERAVTNFYHLLEILHGADSRLKLGEEGLASWLEERIGDPDSRSREEHELRAESDSAAVQIITLHRSKGLEFPVVFLPFAWEGDPRSRSTGKGTLEKVHDENGKLRLVFAPDAGEGPWTREDQEAEARLLYVGLTRAQVRQYLYLPFHGGPKSSPLARVLGVESLDAAVPVLSDLAGAHPECFEMAVCSGAVDGVSAAGNGVSPVDHRPLHPPEEPPEVGRQTMMTSFSALVAGREVERPDHDDWLDPASGEFSPENPQGDLTDLPAGARSGSLLHEILQYWDFPEPSPSRRDLPRQLGRFGYDAARWKEPLSRFLERLGSLSLGGGDSTRFRLCDLPGRQLVREPEFTLPVERLDPLDLSRALTDEPEWLKGGMDRLRFTRVEGFLKGFIDLVIDDGEGYWLLDWKSNHLGNQVADYSEDRLLREMAHHHYGLQGALYTLALHRYLTAADPEYSYERKFRGALYLFLRGADLRAPEKGLVFFRLQRDTIDRLDRLCA